MLGKLVKLRDIELYNIKRLVRNRYILYLTTLLCIDTGLKFAPEETKDIGLAQDKADSLFSQAVQSAENSINK